MINFKAKDITFSFTINCVSIILFCQYIQISSGQTHRNTVPLNINFLTSTPWDVANSLRTPLGGPLSLVLATFLACIMIFGLLIAPIQYMFGDPIRTYHYHDPSSDYPASIIARSLRLQDEVFQFDGMQRNHTKKNEEGELQYPFDFHNSIFYFIPEKDVNCKNLILCHAHGFLSLIPRQYVKFYQFISNKIPEMLPEDKNAIITGLEDQGQCSKTFGNCSKNIVTIAKNTFDYVVPRNVKFNVFTLLSYFD